MICGIFKTSKYYPLGLLFILLIVFIFFGIKPVDATTLVKSLDLSSMINISTFYADNYGCGSPTSTALVMSSQKIYATSTATSTTVLAMRFEPTETINNVSQLGGFISSVPTGVNTGVQVAVYRLDDWNYSSVSFGSKATSSAQTLIGLSNVVYGVLSTGTETRFLFNSPMYFQANVKYAFVYLNWSGVQAQPLATWTTATPDIVSLITNVPAGCGATGEGLTKTGYAYIWTSASSTLAWTKDGIAMLPRYFNFLPYSSDFMITATINTTYFIPFILYSNYSDISGCGDTNALNYNPLANIDDGSCVYSMPTATASSTKIISFNYSTTTKNITLDYNIKIGDNVYLYFQNQNDRDGIIQSSYYATVGSPLIASTTQPSPLSGSGYTILTAKIVSKLDYSVIYDTKQIIIDLASGSQIISTQNYEQQPCGITNLTGCVSNALAGAFYPTQDSINSYYNFIALIQTKAPVGYFTMVKNNITGLNSTSTPAFTIVIPIHLKTYFFNPFDTGIAGILWLFFAINFYKRLKHITV